MGKRTVGNVSYSEQLFQGPDFSELCEYNGHCGYLNCRFRHYGENPRDKLKKELKTKIGKKEKKKQKKKKQREKRSNKKKNLKKEVTVNWCKTIPIGKYQWEFRRDLA